MLSTKEQNQIDTKITKNRQSSIKVCLFLFCIYFFLAFLLYINYTVPQWLLFYNMHSLF